MKSYRLNRLFNAKSGKCFDVAVDHGFFNTVGFLTGIESMPKTIETLVNAAPDAIQLTTGQARHLQSVAGKNKPALVLRTDTANIYGKELPDVRFNIALNEPILQAVRLDAACVCVNLFIVPGAPEIHQQCIENIMKMKVESDHYGMPMMIEPLVFRNNESGGGYTVNGDCDAITHIVRQAIELGADVIKADPTDDVSQYHKIVENCGGVPILVRGGGKVDNETLLKRTEELLDQGVDGIVYGRNVIQHDSPAGITKALMAMLHDSADVKTALELV
jgi:class I fructose-bisphosphate aldolase